MKHFLMLILAIIVVWIVWRIVAGLVVTVLGLAFHLALIIGLCYVVYLVFKALTGEKERV